MNTIRNRPRRPRARLLGAVSLALGLGLLGLGGPRLAAAVLALPGADAVAAASQGRSLGAGELAAAVTATAAAGRWDADGQRQADLGLLLMRQGKVADAAAATADALALSPAQPGPWARLAWLRERTGNPRGAAAALRLSLLSGPVAPALTGSRLQLGLSLLADMDDETRGLLRQQIRLAQAVDPAAVTPLAADRRTGSFVRDALAAVKP